MDIGSVLHRDRRHPRGLHYPCIIERSQTYHLDRSAGPGITFCSCHPIASQEFQGNSSDYAEPTFGACYLCPWRGLKAPGGPVKAGSGASPPMDRRSQQPPWSAKPEWVGPSRAGPAPGRGEAGAMRLPTLQLRRTEPSLTLETGLGWASKAAELVAMKGRGLLPRSSYCLTRTRYCIS